MRYEPDASRVSEAERATHRGRVVDLEFRKNGNRVHRYQYGYDLAGDRMYARVTQLTEGGVSQANTRLALYGYDELKRFRGTAGR